MLNQQQLLLLSVAAVMMAMLVMMMWWYAASPMSVLLVLPVPVCTLDPIVTWFELADIGKEHPVNHGVS